MSRICLSSFLPCLVWSSAQTGQGHAAANLGTPRGRLFRLCLFVCSHLSAFFFRALPIHTLMQDSAAACVSVRMGFRWQVRESRLDELRSPTLTRQSASCICPPLLPLIAAPALAAHLNDILALPAAPTPRCCFDTPACHAGPSIHGLVFCGVLVDGLGSVSGSARRLVGVSLVWATKVKAEVFDHGGDPWSAISPHAGVIHARCLLLFGPVGCQRTARMPCHGQLHRTRREGP